MAVGQETKDLLEQVKKGKPRKFVMLTKGASIVSLVLFKKGSVSKYLKQAKAEGKGVPCYGVVDGKGMDIDFKLAVADGFDKAPAKTTVLKSFLEEEADLKCKPQFVIVQAQQIVLDEDDPLQAKFMQLSKSALAACEAHPKEAPEINRLCEEIGRAFEADEGSPEAAKAEPGLVALEGLLKSLTKTTSESAPKSEEPSAVDSTKQATSGPDIEARRAKLQEALNKIVPQLKQAVAQQPAKKTELLTPVAQIKKQIDQGQLDEAKEGLIAVGKLLKELLSQSTAAPGAPVATDSQAKYEAKLAALQPRFDQSLRDMLGDTSKFRAVMAYAQEQATAGVFDKASLALDRLAPLMEAALATPTAKETNVIPPGVVEDRKKFLDSRWQSVVGQMRAEIDKLHAISPDLVPPANTTGMVDAIHKWLDRFVDRLNAAILNTRTATDTDSSSLKVAVTAIQEFQGQISKEPMIQHLGAAKRDLGISVDIESLLTQSLSELESRLAG